MRNLYFRISTFYSLISTKHTAINKILTPHGLSVIGGNKRQKVKILKFRMWFKYGLKAQKLLTQGIARKQHALKGQKLLAQGIALGIMAISKAPCKGKSFINCLEF